MTLRTEDTGKMFEMAICLAYGIPYDGKYKYSMDAPMALKPRLERLTELFPACAHTAKRGARYDFTAVSDPSLHLSAKTTKKGVGKVAPQCIGQSQPKKFCELVGIPTFDDVADLKAYIQANICAILPKLVEYTFDCPNLYYNADTGSIQYIRLVAPIAWETYTLSWTCSAADWKNSSTLKLHNGTKEIALVLL